MKKINELINLLNNQAMVEKIEMIVVVVVVVLTAFCALCECFGYATQITGEGNFHITKLNDKEIGKNC